MHPAQQYAATVDTHTVATFRALVEAIVPNTPALAVYGAEQAAGAVELHVHECMVWELDHSLALFLGTHPLCHYLLLPPNCSMQALFNSSPRERRRTHRTKRCGEAAHSPHFHRPTESGLSPCWKSSV